MENKYSVGILFTDIMTNKVSRQYEFNFFLEKPCHTLFIFVCLQKHLIFV